MESQAPNGQGALVTVSRGKHYSDGLDLSYVLSELPDNDAKMAFLKRVDKLFARLLTFPMITVAAVNGHAFAGGMLLALCHDYRVGNQTKGFWCMTEINMGARLTPGFSMLINSKMPAALTSHMMITATRLDSKQMKQDWGIVHELGEGEAQVLEKAIKLAGSYADKGKQALGEIKQDVWWEAWNELCGNTPYRSSKM